MLGRTLARLARPLQFARRGSVGSKYLSCWRRWCVGRLVLTWSRSPRRSRRAAREGSGSGRWSCWRGDGVQGDHCQFGHVQLGDLVMQSRPLGSLKLLDEMERKGITANSVTFSSAISACSKGGQWERARMLLKEMERKGIECDHVQLGNLGVRQGRPSDRMRSRSTQQSWRAARKAILPCPRLWRPLLHGGVHHHSRSCFG